jgi:hypothetical protein
MGCRASLHADQARRQLPKKVEQICATKRPPRNIPIERVDRVNLEYRLG